MSHLWDDENISFRCGVSVFEKCHIDFNAFVKTAAKEYHFIYVFTALLTDKKITH